MDEMSYMPYIPRMVDTDTFQPRLSIASRYGLAMVNNRYYEVFRIENKKNYLPKPKKFKLHDRRRI
jgi:hypothetical protein